MSLTEFLAIPEVKEAFLQEFKKPDFKVNQQIRAPPQTKRYALIGTAFDYLLRFIILKGNPNAKEKEWVAVNSLLLLPENDAKKAYKIILEAKENQKNYLFTGRMTTELMASCIKLAQLDAVYRAGYVDPNLGYVDELDILDLKNLASIVELQKFKANKLCLLNPTFGKASELVGGADCDLIIDDILIDIKTVKNLELTRDYFNQLIGYYILSHIWGVDGAPQNHKIKRIGIYFARHGYLHIYDLADIIDENKINEFTAWFITSVKQVYHT